LKNNREENNSMFYEQKQKVDGDIERNDATKIYLQVDKNEDDAAEIDIVNVAVNMGRRRKLYAFVMAVAICIGLLAGFVKIFIGQVKKEDCYAQAVLTLQFDGIEDGLDPNGASFDINKLKSPNVIQEALDNIGETSFSVDSIRQNISIEGIIPEDAVERITVIKEMSVDNISNYEKILDVSYFPSQYVVYLYQQKGMSASQNKEILNAILDSYKEYFLDTYANTAVLTVTSNLLDYDSYDYQESIDMISSQIEIMQNYVNERMEQAPDFRASSTGLSFGDIATSLSTIDEVDLPNLSAYVESITLTKDKERLVEYYNYRIKDYNMQMSEIESNLTTVQNTIDNYVKDPVVIVSSQESTQELTQSNEYYDSLVEQKITLSKDMASLNTKLNETYRLLNAISNSDTENSQEQYDYADEKLAEIAATISKWAELIEETTDEYYSTTLFSNAVKVSVPAQYKASGGLMSIIKTLGIFVVAMIFIVIVVWCVDGLRLEIIAMRKKNKK
jgi:hypothetical protein